LGAGVGGLGVKEVLEEKRVGASGGFGCPGFRGGD
jgi:hypothetical protein